MTRVRTCWTGVVLTAGLWLTPLWSPVALRAQEPLPVVTSIFPVADLVRNVGREHVSVTVLLPAGASPHTFDPRPSQVRQVAEARILFEIGAGLEAWADKLATASGNPNLQVVHLSEGIPLIGASGDPPSPAGHDHRDAHVNPHIWLDPLNAVSMVKTIAFALAEADPARESVYLENALSYTGDLVALHEEIRCSVDALATRRYVAFHPAWTYFAERYGLEPAGIIEESPGREPSPKHLERIISAIRSYGIPVVFAEPQLNPKAASVIAEEAAVELLFLDPLGGEALNGRDSYLALMRHNLSLMVRAMGRQSEE